jgi:hypothetical protein
MKAKAPKSARLDRLAAMVKGCWAAQPSDPTIKHIEYTLDNLL